MSPTAVEVFLWLLRDNPDLLRRAPGPPTAEQMEERLTETHACFRCPQLAERVLVCDQAEIPGYGHRWLDLCPDCYAWLVEGLNELTTRSELTRRTVNYWYPGEGWR